MMMSQIAKPALAAAAGVCAIAVVYMAWSRPSYFTSQTYIGGLILLELVIGAIWKFRQVFFTVLILAFVLAGTSLPGSSVFTSARWLFLGVGAVVGFLMVLKDHQHHFGFFDAIALFAVLAAAVSASVSRYPSFALLKVLSLFLLFLYAASGATVAVKGREARFLAGMLVGCEVLVGVLAFCYVVFGTDLLGNVNSLGAIVGVVAAPLLLWATFVAQDVATHHRRLFLFGLCLYLVYHSHARASIAAGALSCGLLCVGLRRYRSLILGTTVVLMLVATAAIFQPEQVFETASAVTSEVVYKGKLENGMFASRRTPWQDAVDAIRTHFWFGTGFGTTDKGVDAGQHLGNFSSSSAVSTEYGSSYLEIVTWVGILGVLPFIFLLLTLTKRVFQTMLWIWQTGNMSHPAIPLAAVVAAGIVHAAFEDWMFAPGYYLCVFFWCVAFALVDVTPIPSKARAGQGIAWFFESRRVSSAAAATR
jgi:O-antigen ligase